MEGKRTMRIALLADLHLGSSVGKKQVERMTELVGQCEAGSGGGLLGDLFRLIDFFIHRRSGRNGAAAGWNEEPSGHMGVLGKS